MIEYFLEDFSSYSKLIIYLLVYIIVAFVLCFPMIKSHVIKHWHYYKNKPYIIPISGIFLRDKGDSITLATNKNYMEVLWDIVSGSITSLSQPLYIILGKLVDKLKFFEITLNNFRYQIAITRRFLMHLVKNVYQDLLDAREQVVNQYQTVRGIIQKNFTSMDDILDNVTRTYDYMQYIVFSPIWQDTKLLEGRGRFEFADKYLTGAQNEQFKAACFTGNNPVKLNNGSVKNISDIQIGDVLIYNNKVIAVIHSQIYDKLYLYNNVLVTGDHFVNYNEKWIRVKNIPGVFIADKENYRKVYCLVTQTGEIVINKTRFKDYLDIHNLLIYSKINNLIDTHLNTNTLSKKTYNLLTGIHPDIKILNKDILGKIMIDVGVLDVFYWEGLFLSADTLVYYNNNWIRVSNNFITGAEYIGKNQVPFVNYITTENIIYLSNGEKIRDFIEVNNDLVLGKIDSIIDRNINN